MNVNQFDIVLDVLVVNQTADTLQNLTLELATLGSIQFSAFSSCLEIKRNSLKICNVHTSSCQLVVA